MNARLPVVVASFGVLLLPACGPSRPRGPAAPAPSLLQSWVGQRRILPGRGESRSVSLRRDQAGRTSGGCDVAVEVRRATFDKGTAQLSLFWVGLPRLGEQPISRCGRVPAERTLRVTGFSGAGPDVAATLERVLPTPEGYLVARGTPFSLAAAAAPAFGAFDGLGSTDAERALARQVTAWPRNLLAVEPAWVDPSGRVRHEGLIEFEGVVGADGRLYRPRVVTPLDRAHEAHVAGVLGMWRYEPARRGGDPVAARVSARTILRIR